MEAVELEIQMALGKLEEADFDDGEAEEELDLARLSRDGTNDCSFDEVLAEAERFALKGGEVEYPEGFVGGEGKLMRQGGEAEALEPGFEVLGVGEEGEVEAGDHEW